MVIWGTYRAKGALFAKRSTHAHLQSVSSWAPDQSLPPNSSEVTSVTGPPHLPHDDQDTALFLEKTLLPGRVSQVCSTATDCLGDLCPQDLCPQETEQVPWAWIQHKGDSLYQPKPKTANVKTRDVLPIPKETGLGGGWPRLWKPSGANTTCPGLC